MTKSWEGWTGAAGSKPAPTTIPPLWPPGSVPIASRRHPCWRGTMLAGWCGGLVVSEAWTTWRSECARPSTAYDHAQVAARDRHHGAGGPDRRRRARDDG